jgi:gliding motility-associated lipoprotein GldH
MLIGFFSACDSSVVYEKNLKIKNADWDQGEKALFEFDIDDSTKGYEIYMNFRHGGDYPYQNIYLFTRTVSPSGLIAKDTAQMLLADNKGRWLGKGIGDIFDYQFKYKGGNLFPEKGTYTFQIEQAMREKTLENVTDIGITIKKLNIE